MSKPNGSVFDGLFGAETSARVNEEYRRVLAEEQERQAKEGAACDSEPGKALRVRVMDDGTLRKEIVAFDLIDPSAERDRLAYAKWCESKEPGKWTS